MLWAVFTLIAAAAQTARNAMQRELTATLGTVGATHVRFLFGFPFALLFLFGLMAGAAFTGIVGTLGATFTWDIAHTSSTSPDLEIPKWIVYLCIPLGSYLMCFRFLQVAWHFAKTGELPHHDVAHVEGIEAPAEINPYNLEDNLHPSPRKEGGRS